MRCIRILLTVIILSITFSNNKFNQPFIDVAKNANPSIVSIVTEVEYKQRQFNPFFNDPFFEDFFPQYKRKGQSLGSGVIIDKEGYIITNNHVIENATSIKVILFDKTELEAEIIGVDPLSDLAVIQINTDIVLPDLEMGDSDALSVGEWVVAIGSPFGLHLNHTVTAGIVSAVGRSNVVSKMGFEDFIQHDAAINPGNSGGALLNLDGELIGINTAIATDGYSKSNAGVGFAIPINQAKRVVEDLVSDGKVSRGWVGIQIQNLTDEIVEALSLESKNGAMIISIVPDSPASKSDLMEYDVITKIDNKEIKDDKDLFRTISSKHPGDLTNFIVVRENQKLRISLKLGTRPTENDVVDAKTDSEFDLLGIKTASTENESGAKVISVEKNSIAFNQNIRVNDIITKIGRSDIKSKSDYDKAINEYETDEMIMLAIKRGNNKLVMAFKISD